MIINIYEIIDIMIEKEVVMVPVVDDNTNKIIDVVTRIDIMTEKLKEDEAPFKSAYKMSKF